MDKINNTNKKINSGDLLEYRVSRLIFHMGYYSKIGIELRTSQDLNSELITDLDVLGIRFNKDFSEKDIWADCKSGRAKTLERISWLVGIKKQLHFDDILFVKSNVKAPIKDFARNNDIQILDLRILDRLEKDFSISNNMWEGSWNPHVLIDVKKNFSKIQAPQNSQYKKIYKFLTSDYWHVDKYTSFKKCITAISELSKLPIDILDEDDRKSIKWAFYESVSLFTLSLLKIVRELYFMDDNERKSMFHDRIISGEISLKKRTELVSASYRLAFNLIKQQQPEFEIPENLSGPISITPPLYFESAAMLVDKVVSNPLDYYDILRSMDYIFFQYDFFDKKIKIDELNKKFGNINNNEKGIKNILHFLNQVADLPKEFFGMINN
ncbi:TPA: hypothetical protein ACHJYD_001955 [Enterococcus faecalis]